MTLHSIYLAYVSVSSLYLINYLNEYKSEESPMISSYTIFVNLIIAVEVIILIDIIRFIIYPQELGSQPGWIASICMTTPLLFMYCIFANHYRIHGWNFSICIANSGECDVLCIDPGQKKQK